MNARPERRWKTRARNTAVVTKPTSEIAREHANNPQQLAALQEIVHFKLLATAGGVPIVREGRVIGAIGVVGTSAEQDEQIAAEAIT